MLQIQTMSNVSQTGYVIVVYGENQQNYSFDGQVARDIISKLHI